MAPVKSLTDRLRDGDTIVVAWGYLMEIKGRGYLKNGPFVPEVVLENPKIVRDLHEEFVHAGSDVVLAFTYNAHREKLREIGRENDLEKLNRTALRIAREVADETGTLMAGSISKTTIYKSNDPKVLEEVYDMFKEQARWAVEGGADFIVCETFMYYEKAAMALEVVKKYGNGLPAVVTLAPFGNETIDKVSFGEACRKLEIAGAAVVGLNCQRGLGNVLYLLKEIRKDCKGPVASIPVCYRTSDAYPVYFALPDIDHPDKPAFPVDLPPWLCSQRQIAEFTNQAKALGVQYFGLCCGNKANCTRNMAEQLGHKPPASKYAPDMANDLVKLKDDRYSSMHQIYNQYFKTE